MGRIIVIAVAIAVMIAGGAVGVMKQLGIGPFASDEEAATEEVVVDPTANQPRFVAIDPLVISLFSGDQIATTLQIEVKLETRGSENVGKLMKMEPRMNNAFIQEMSSYLPRIMAKNEGMPLNVTLVKQRLKLVADRVAGDGIVNSVLIQSVLDRRSQ